MLHTTETDNYPKSTSSYFGNNFWPHATIGVVGGKWHIWQHIPINRAARALQHPAGTVETNNQSAVQCEIVWRAGKAREMPAALMDGVRAWMRWVEATVGVQRRSPAFYGQDAGFTLASSSARQRMTAASWKAFDGWCGHQHVPANSHWDPGAIDIKSLLGESEPPAQPIEEDEDDMMVWDKVENKAYILAGNVKLYVTDTAGRTKLPVVDHEDLVKVPQARNT